MSAAEIASAAHAFFAMRKLALPERFFILIAE